MARCVWGISREIHRRVTQPHICSALRPGLLLITHEQRQPGRLALEHMADPLSIVASCVGLAAAAAKTSVAITSFIRTTRDARKELTETRTQLTELESVLDLLRHDSEGEGGSAIPESVRSNIEGIIGNCNASIRDLQAVMEKHKAKTGPLRFTFTGKEDILALNRQLSTHTRALNIALDFSAL